MTEYRVFHKSIPRNEDRQLLTGNAQFVDDIEIPGMLHAAFKRADFAHARISNINIEEAKNIPGVYGVFTFEDFGALVKPG
ncbi:MAG TPA: hypothetical protein PKD55_16660, partial [Bellilinea sp.]|nr:hypothetical protein [Bellilinea sp.]